MEEKVEDYETCSSEKLSNSDYMVNDLNTKIEEECAFDYENIISTFTCVKPKENEKKYHQLETASYCINDALDVENMKGELPQGDDICTKIEGNYFVEKNQNFIIKSEEEINDATSESVKYEEIDIKYEPLGDVRLSSTINGEIGIGSYYTDCNETLTPMYKPLVDLTAVEDKYTADNLPEKPTYKCSFCSYVGTRKSYLTRHIRYNHRDPSKIKMYDCGICCFTTRQRKSWKDHKLNFSHLTEEEEHQLKNERPPEKPIYKCNTCGYSPQFKKDLLKHISEHKLSDFAEEDIFKCDKCDYRSSHERNFKAHVSIVHTSKMHKCSMCNYANKNKRCLTEHMLKHSGYSATKMFKCDKCNYVTAYKRSLKIHSLSHQDSQIYSCDQCSYETKYKKYLIVHINEGHKKDIYTAILQG